MYTARQQPPPHRCEPFLIREFEIDIPAIDFRPGAAGVARIRARRPRGSDSEVTGLETESLLAFPQIGNVCFDLDRSPFLCIGAAHGGCRLRVEGQHHIGLAALIQLDGSLAIGLLHHRRRGADIDPLPLVMRVQGRFHCGLARGHPGPDSHVSLSLAGQATE